MLCTYWIFKLLFLSGCYINFILICFIFELFFFKLIYLNVTIIPIVNTLMVVFYIILYQIIEKKKDKKKYPCVVSSFPPSLCIYIYNVLLCIIILCHIFYHVSNKGCIMRNCQRWNFNIYHIFFIRLNIIRFLQILKSYEMAVKNRGVLAAVKLSHTRIFINIKKNTWYTSYKCVGFRTVTGRWRHLVTRRDNQKNTYVKT